MKRANAPSKLSGILFGVSLLLLAGSGTAEISNSVFEQHCSRCHASATQFKTPPEKIMTLLQSGSIRQHRYSLDEQTLQTIIRYIQQQKS